MEPVADVRSPHRSLSQVMLQKLRFTPVRAQPTSIRSALEEYEPRNSAVRDHSAIARESAHDNGQHEVSQPWLPRASERANEQRRYRLPSHCSGSRCSSPRKARRRALATGVFSRPVSSRLSARPSVLGGGANAQASVPCAICGVPRHVSGR